jgi:hypothetical protein
VGTGRHTLGLPLDDLAAELQHRPVNRQVSGVEVRACPAEADRFAAPRAAQHDDPEHQAERVAGARGHEPHRLGGAPPLRLRRLLRLELDDVDRLCVSMCLCFHAWFRNSRSAACVA